MSDQPGKPDVSKPKEDPTDSRTAEEQEELDAIADDAASRAGKEERRYDEDHNIFTK